MKEEEMGGMNYDGEEMGQTDRWDVKQQRKRIVSILLLILAILFAILCLFDEGPPWPF